MRATAVVFCILLCGCSSSGNDAYISSVVSQLTGGEDSATLNSCTLVSPCSIWSTSATPTASDNTTSVELGVKVQSSEAGYISGVRFYKDDTNNSTHVVNLWDRSGNLLATAASTSEASSGWQAVNFAQPVQVSANTTYVASYFMPGGNFALDRPGFTNAVVNAPLTALADGQDGGNGVYAYGGSSSFPASSVSSSNYWVDVLFSTTTTAGGDGGGVGGDSGDGATVNACTPSSPCSVWSASTTPVGSDTTTAVELGVKVQSSEAGYIRGIRFYKDDTNNPTHVVNLWDRSGNLLATATSTSETTSGWQTVTFAQPVPANASTTYVASYFMPGGNFALDRPGFTNAVVNAPLTALADGQDGGNGVYAYGGSSSFPTSSVSSSNYWVDVLFSTTATAGSSDGGGSDGESSVDGGDAGQLSDGGDGGSSNTCTPSSPCSIWSSPATPAGADTTTAVELGVKVQSSEAGYITGIRFYKDDTNNATHTVNLWDRSGNLLATATSTSETSSGWQSVSFMQPVAVSANTTYVASYLMPGGNFALDRPGFTNAVVNAPLEALADGQDGSNGVYAYGSSSSFPTNSVGASNYWVDVLFTATALGTTDDGGAAGSDGGPATIQDYVAQYAQAFCSGLGKCCPGYPAAFDLGSCAVASTTGGWEHTLPAISAVYTNGHLTFNAERGAACISALQNFPCTTGGTVTAAQYAAVTTACNGVLTGTISFGTAAPCIASFECANGYCDFPGEPSYSPSGYALGLCHGLPSAPIGVPCDPTGGYEIDSLDQQCSQAGAYPPNGAWCNFLGAPSSPVCAAPVADGATCSNPTTHYRNNMACASLMCGDLGCGGTTAIPTVDFCAKWTVDGG